MKKEELITALSQASDAYVQNINEKIRRDQFKFDNQLHFMDEVLKEVKAA